MTYAIETDIEGMLSITIDATSRPTTTHLAVMLANADAKINAFIKQSSNITDTYGILKAVACGLVHKMMNNMFNFAEPDSYDFVEVLLTEEDKDLIRRAHSVWQVLSWEMKGP